MPKHNATMENSKKGQKRKINSDQSQTSNTSARKKKAVSKQQNDEDTVVKSKQLVNKLNKAKRRSRLSTNKPNELRNCQNGKPMPPLTVLEEMFEDSDSDIEPNTATAKSCITPTKKARTVSKKNSLSPTTVKEITSSLVDKISNLTNPSDIFNILPLPPVVPQNNEHKSDTPYIVGCKDRPQIKRKLNTSFCKGDKYGVHSKQINEKNCHKEPKKKSKIDNVSKSIFNTQSKQIASTLNDIDSDSSNSSTDTIPYNYNTSASNRSLAFSPLPSTSKDNDTIMKNEKLFNKSLSSDNLSNSTNNNSQPDAEILDISNSEMTSNEVELVQTPSNENTETNNANKSLNSVKIIENVYDTIVIDDICDNPMTNGKIHNNVDNSVQITGPVKKRIIEDNSIIDVDDYYASININMVQQPYDDNTEIIDIDSLTQENNAVLKNLKASKKIDKLTVVKANCGRTTSTDHQGTNVRNKDAINCVRTQSNPTNHVNVHSTNRNGEINNTSDLVVDITNLDNSNIHDNRRSNSVENSALSIVGAQAEPSKQPSLTNNNPTLCTAGICQDKEHSGMESIISMQDELIDELVKKHQMLQKFCTRSVHNILNSIAKTMENNRNKEFTNIRQSNSRARNTINITGDSSTSQSQDSAPNTSSANFYLGDCPVCMDSLCNNPIASTTCGHLFCVACIRSALRVNGKKCPTCRAVLKGNKCYHPIFF